MDNLFITDIVILKDEDQNLSYLKELEEYITDTWIPYELKPNNLNPKFKIITKRSSKFNSFKNECGYGALTPILILINSWDQRKVFYSQNKDCCIKSLTEFTSNYVFLSDRLCFNKQKNIICSIDDGIFNLDKFTVKDLKIIQDCLNNNYINKY